MFLRSKKYVIIQVEMGDVCWLGRCCPAYNYAFNRKRMKEVRLYDSMSLCPQTRQICKREGGPITPIFVASGGNTHFVLVNGVENESLTELARLLLVGVDCVDAHGRGSEKEGQGSSDGLQSILQYEDA